MPIANLLINGLSPVVVGGTGVSLKLFPSVPNAPAFPIVAGGAPTSIAAKNGYVFVPGNGAANAQRLSVRASGNFTVGGDVASPAFTIGLYAATFVGSVGTVISTPILSATAAGSTDTGGFTTYYPWSLNADLIADGVTAQGNQLVNSAVPGSGLATLISGSVQIDGANTNATAGLISGLTGINMGASIPFGLVVGVTYGSSGSGNLAAMYQFDISM